MKPFPSKLVLERYEYDAYGEPTIWDGYFTTTRQTSNYDNFDLLSGGGVKKEAPATTFITRSDEAGAKTGGLYINFSRAAGRSKQKIAKKMSWRR
jgi:hypothetical protein